MSGMRINRFIVTIGYPPYEMGEGRYKSSEYRIETFYAPKEARSKVDEDFLNKSIKRWKEDEPHVKFVFSRNKNHTCLIFSSGQSGIIPIRGIQLFLFVELGDLNYIKVADEYKKEIDFIIDHHIPEMIFSEYFEKEVVIPDAGQYSRRAYSKPVFDQIVEKLGCVYPLVKQGDSDALKELEKGSEDSNSVFKEMSRSEYYSKISRKWEKAKMDLDRVYESWTTRIQTFNDGVELFKQGKYRSAIDKLNRATDSDRDSIIAYLLQGLSYERLNDDNMAEIHFSIAEDWWSDKNYDEVIGVYAKFRKEYPLDERFLWWMAEISRVFEQYDEAFSYYDTILAKHPLDYRAWYGKGKIYTELEQYEQALDCYERAWDGDKISRFVFLLGGMSRYSRHYNPSLELSTSQCPNDLFWTNMMEHILFDWNELDPSIRCVYSEQMKYAWIIFGSGYGAFDLKTGEQLFFCVELFDLFSNEHNDDFQTEIDFLTKYHIPETLFALHKRPEGVTREPYKTVIDPMKTLFKLVKERNMDGIHALQSDLFKERPITLEIVTSKTSVYSRKIKSIQWEETKSDLGFMYESCLMQYSSHRRNLVFTERAKYRRDLR